MLSESVIAKLFVVIKLTERCDLACPYCYYFESESSDAFTKPALMSRDVLSGIVDYCELALNQQVIREIVFVFHGGEPTLIDPRVVLEFCSLAHERLAAHARVIFSLQTNAVNMRILWFDLLVQKHFNVGVSVDGERETHDMNRPDKRGRGTYQRVAANVARLVGLHHDGEISLSVLGVMRPGFNALNFYHEVTDKFCVKNMNILFLDNTPDSMNWSREQLVALGDSLADAFDYWFLNDCDTVNVELFANAVRSVLTADFGGAQPGDHYTIGLTVRSDGEVTLPDEYYYMEKRLTEQKKYSIFESDFVAWASNPTVNQILDAFGSIPSACVDCSLSRICRGGDPHNRFSVKNGFENRSAYCESLLRYYGRVRDHVHRHVMAIDPLSPG